MTDRETTLRRWRFLECVDKAKRNNEGNAEHESRA